MALTRASLLAGSVGLGLLLAGCTFMEPYDEPPQREEPRPTKPLLPYGTFGQLPPGNVMLGIETFETDETDRTVVEAAVRYRVRNIDVQAGSLGGRNGLTIWGAKGGLSGALRVAASRSKSSRTTQQSLMVAEGRHGSFQVLQVRPEPWLVVIPIFRGVVLATTVREQVTGSGLFLKVHRADEKSVDAELLPYFRRAKDGSALAIEELRTRVTLVPGVPYVVSSFQDHKNSFGHSFLTYSREGRKRQITQVLTVQVGKEQ